MGQIFKHIRTEYRSMMKYNISHADFWEEFEEVWIAALKSQRWYNSPNIVDYNPYSEREELKDDFENDDHIYLIARDEDGVGVGVLEFKCYPNYAKNGVMMPGVKDSCKQFNIGDALLQFQEFYLKNRNIEPIISSIKYTSREEVEWYFDTLTRNGFKMNEPEGFQMYVNLESIESFEGTDQYRMLTRNNFAPEDFVEFAIRSYASTPEDLQIHGWDKSVTEPDQIRAIHKYTIDGAFGKSPSEWWRVIEKDKNPLGYILGFELEPERKTRVGTIGNLGVFPEYRRQGLAVLLIHSLLREFQNDGIQYARVGTPTMNVRAIGAYKKAGFIDGNRIQFFRKDI